MNTKKRKHHYVWRKYLRAWSVEEMIWCLREKKIFKSNLTGVGQERDFYKLKILNLEEINFIKDFIKYLPPHLQKQHLDLLKGLTLPPIIASHFSEKSTSNELETLIYNLEEDLHSTIENSGISILNHILDKKEISLLKGDDNYLKFIYFLTYQYMRTRKIRENVINGLKDDPRIKVDIEKVINILSHILATQMAWNLFVERKQVRIILLENNSPIKIITADQPVINTYAVNAPPDQELKDIELYYPVSPNLAIIVTEKSKYLTGDKIIFLEAEVIKYNQFMIEQSHNQIYASSEELLKNIHP